MKKKNKKKNYVPFVIIFIILFGFNCYYYYNIATKYFAYKKEKNELSEKALDYIEEKYNINPEVYYITDVDFENEKYEEVDMTYNGYDITVKIYENDRYEDNYMNLVLGNTMYDSIVDSLKKAYSTNLITVDEKNSIFFWYDETITGTNITVEDILDNNDKVTSISVSLTFINNEKLSDEEISNIILEWIKTNIKEKGIDYVTLNINFVNKSDSNKIDNDINNSNEYAKRYIFLSEAVEDVDIETTNSSIYVRGTNNFFTRPFVNE